MFHQERIVITGIGLTSPIGDDLPTLRSNLLNGHAHIDRIPMRYMGEVLAGQCKFETTRYQKRKEVRNGTRAGSIGIYCAHEALKSAGLELALLDLSRIGIYLGITEHGNVETENEIYNISQFDYDTKFWTHHHNPRTVANNPAGEVSMNLKITGPHYTIGAACAAGNAGLIQAVQMLRLGEVDMALAGGISESTSAFGIFAGFKSQGALAEHDTPNQASRPFDMDRNGIVVSEGGCIYTVERLSDAQKRGAPIIAEVSGYCINSDAMDAVLPHPERQVQCMEKALKMAKTNPEAVNIVSTHATATKQGDIQECTALKTLFGKHPQVRVNNTKSFIGHAMGAAGALELAGNLSSFEDNHIHATINVDNLDPECAMDNLVLNEAVSAQQVDTILNNSFGMLGINSCVVIKKMS